MSQTLYEEAIAEARRLTEMAEQNAKNKIIDAVTPQIKRLIEAELLKGGEGSESDDDVEGDSPVGDIEQPSDVIDLDALAADGSPGGHEAPAPEMKMTPLKGVTSFNTEPDGTIEIETDDLEIEIKPKEPEEEDLNEVIASSPASRRRMRERIVALEGKVEVLKRAINEARGSGTAAQKQRIANIFEQLAKEAVSLRSQAILTERKTGGRTLEANIINSIIKEMKHMSRRANKNAFDFLFEADEDEKKPEASGDADTDMDMDMDVTDTGSDEMASDESDVDESAVADALETLGKALGVSVTVDAGGESPADDMDMDMGTEDLESDEEESDTESDEDEEEEDLEEMSYTEVDSDDKPKESASKPYGMGEGKVFEVNESALRRELLRLRRLNESDPTSGSGASSFGGGKAGDDMFVDVDEETLLNALADELGTVKKPKKAPVSETRRATAAYVNEAAALRRQVSDYRNVAGQLKKQLVEMNLFNAKLLYANKLMQNRDLSAKQQRAIVEALDNAKTLREAKLLYKSLTTSLNKASNSGSLTEGRSSRIFGSSSKSARSAQPNLVSEGVAGETDRWALLAGIKKD